MPVGDYYNDDSAWLYDATIAAKFYFDCDTFVSDHQKELDKEYWNGVEPFIAVVNLGEAMDYMRVDGFDQKDKE